jgi:hypothetical protein
MDKLETNDGISEGTYFAELFGLSPPDTCLPAFLKTMRVEFDIVLLEHIPPFRS